MENFLKTILEKISSYDILNNLIPGAMYIMLTDKMTSWHLISDSMWTNLIIFYVAGMIIGRIGSLIIEPAMRKERKKNNGERIAPFIDFAPYGDYIKAERADPKVKELSMTNNVYRSFVTVFICLVITMMIDFAVPQIWHYRVNNVIGCLLLAVLFAFAYRKQTGYIRKRVQTILERNENDSN